MRLEDIADGQVLDGLSSIGPVTVEKVRVVGGAAAQVMFRDISGSLHEDVLYRDAEDRLFEHTSKPIPFDADADDFKLASEAYRLGLAYLFDPYLAVHSSSIEPLPHQITAVYQEMLSKLPLRYVLADDPGAGKTVMAGLLIKEMLARGDLRRCLIVCPGSLCEQWQDELYEKFGLSFTILTNDLLEASVTRNAFAEHDLCIARLDKLSRDEAVKEKLAHSTWDLVVCDEAHKMAAHAVGNRVNYTKRYRLGELLGSIAENLLLMTATPHDGKNEDFQLFMALVDPDRFDVAHGVAVDQDVSDVMRRLVKEDLLTFDGRPLFPERRAYTVKYELSPAEKDLYESVTSYVCEEFNRAERLDGKQRNSVGFALTTLQRRLASSPEAICQSLRRRRERLQSQLELASRIEDGRISFECDDAGQTYRLLDDDFDEDDLPAERFERLQDEFIGTASASATVNELKAEVETLKHLEEQARALRDSGRDRKWEELSALLQDDAHMFDGAGAREKLIIFTEHKDTLAYLRDRIANLLGDVDEVVTIQGGMRRDDRREVQRRFTQDKEVRVLIATDAAGEGINLQRAHLMINYDLPWNPNRLEQRFGRIHRIGQTEVCHLWNLVSESTREGEVFQRLFDKLSEERNALGGKVFDVLGRVSFGERSLADLLVEAIRYGNDPARRAQLDQVVDASLDSDALRRLVDEYSLTDDLLSVHDVAAVGEDMQRAAAHKLAPYYLETFFLSALRRFEGRVARREPGRYEVKRVPSAVLQEARRQGIADVSKRYERITFERDRVNVPGRPTAELIVPGHPLLESLRGAVQTRFGSLLGDGAVLVDDGDWGKEPRVLVYVECAVEDDTAHRSEERHTVSRSLRFVESTNDGEVEDAGYAPYLDYRAPKQDELEALQGVLTEGAQLSAAGKDRILAYALTDIVPGELSRIRMQRKKRIDKISRAVDERLTAEIRYWDARAAKLAEQERQGKGNARLNAENARSRADELSIRRTERLRSLEAERTVHATSPRLVGQALVVPRGLIARLKGEQVPPGGSSSRASIEAIAMQAVLRIEHELGYEPHDVSKENCGYDIESKVPEDAESPVGLRCIEVKGRSGGAGSVMVSHNEVNTALSLDQDYPGSYVLAVVEVSDDSVRTTYIAHPFKAEPDPAMAATNYSIQKLLAQGEVLIVREEAR